MFEPSLLNSPINWKGKLYEVYNLRQELVSTVMVLFMDLQHCPYTLQRRYNADGGVHPLIKIHLKACLVHLLENLRQDVCNLPATQVQQIQCLNKTKL